MVEIKLNGEWTDITELLLNEIDYDRRSDEVFDSGTFSFQSKTIDYNIAPLTHCRIDGKLWLCSSESTLMRPKMYWNHDVSLLEPTYMAHTVIIGSKKFSNKGAYKTHNKKIRVLVELATSKNRLLFGTDADEYVIEPLIDSKNIEREFNFGAGTSLFQSLLEIGKTVNAIPQITDTSEGVLGQTIYNISWNYLDINNEFTLDERQILGIKYFQDVENYTAILETEMKDVVDRDTIVEVKNLTVRSEDFYVDSDNQVLILPSKVEEITDLRILYDSIPVTVTISFLPSTGWADGLYEGVTYAWDDLNKREVQSPIMQYLYDKLDSYNYPVGTNMQILFQTKSGTSYKQFIVDYSNQPSNITAQGIPINDLILEKSQWDLLDVSEQPKYFVYESGSDKIENIYSKYKGDVWSNILNITTNGALQSNDWNIIINDTIIESDGDTDVYKDFEFYIYGGLIGTTEAYYNPIKGAKFNVKYKPMVNTFVKSKNNKRPFNEDKIKYTSRSFEGSASIADFNLLAQAIDKTNEMLGMPEITISYSGANYPNAGNMITIKDREYYVTSVQTSIISGKYISYINLVSSYSKIAEVFGVASQYESTKLPLNGIVDRYVYCGKYNNSMNYTIHGIRLGYTDSNGSTKYVYKRGAYVSYDGTTYFIVSANDNYCFETGIVVNDKIKASDTYENKQYVYADSNNEQVTYTLGLAIEPDVLSIEYARDLPNLPYVYFNNILTNDSVKVYKDARERLIFIYEII